MRILLAPENPAGVASALHEGLHELGHDADLVVRRPHTFVLPDERVAAGYSRRVWEGLCAPLRYDVLHWQFGTTHCEYIDAAWGRVAGRPLQLMHYWGDDVRTLSAARALGSPRIDALALQAGERSDRVVRMRLRLAARLCRAALTSDLELAQYAGPWFRRIYVVPTPIAGLHPDPPGPPLAGKGPIVFHAPSDPRTKGTPEIKPLLERLGAEGVLRPRILSGVPRSQVLMEIARADVVVDQLYSDTPGVFALEAMALGRPVLLQFRRELLAGPMRESPLIAVTPGTLERELRALCRDPQRRARAGEEGRGYVERVHAAARVAAALVHVYAHAPDAAEGRYIAGPEGVRPLPDRVVSAQR